MVNASHVAVVPQVQRPVFLQLLVSATARYVSSLCGPTIALAPVRFSPNHALLVRQDTSNHCPRQLETLILVLLALQTPTNLPRGKWHVTNATTLARRCRQPAQTSIIASARPGLKKRWTIPALPALLVNLVGTSQTMATTTVCLVSLARILTLLRVPSASLAAKPHP